jgi:hypothetical protein
MLQAHVDDIETIDENLRPLYKQETEGAGWTLEVDLDSQKEMKEKVKEFRKHNIELQKKLSEFEEKFKPYAELDLEQVHEAMAAQKKVADAELLPRAEVEKHIASRLEDERSKFAQELADAQELAHSSQHRLNELVIERDVTEAINKVGQLQKGALGDVLRRARIDIEVKDGKLTERDTGLTLDTKEWAIKLMKDSPFFFVPNTGINARGSSTAEIEKNPWKSETKNLTEQGRLFKEDPVKARRLAAEAGMSI